jgi:hypothetical protein
MNKVFMWLRVTNPRDCGELVFIGNLPFDAIMQFVSEHREGKSPSEIDEVIAAMVAVPAIGLIAADQATGGIVGDAIGTFLDIFF